MGPEELSPASADVVIVDGSHVYDARKFIRVEIFSVHVIRPKEPTGLVVHVGPFKNFAVDVVRFPFHGDLHVLEFREHELFAVSHVFFPEQEHYCLHAFTREVHVYDFLGGTFAPGMEL